MSPLLPKDWRRRRGLLPRQARFSVEGERGTWDLVDWAYAAVIGFDRKADAQEAHAFAREYVKRHGDIDFGSFPYQLSDTLHYDDPEQVERFWEIQYP